MQMMARKPNSTGSSGSGTGGAGSSSPWDAAEASARAVAGGLYPETAATASGSKGRPARFTGPLMAVFTTETAGLAAGPSRLPFWLPGMRPGYSIWKWTMS